MVPSIRDKDNGGMVHINNFEERANIELMKQLEEPESTNPKNGRDVSGEWRVVRRELGKGVLAAPSFKSGPRALLRQSPPRGRGGLPQCFLGLPMV